MTEPLEPTPGDSQQMSGEELAETFGKSTCCTRHLRWTAPTTCRICLYEEVQSGRPPARLSTEPRDILRTATRQHGGAYAIDWAEEQGWDYEALVGDDPCEPEA